MALLLQGLHPYHNGTITYPVVGFGVAGEPSVRVVQLRAAKASKACERSTYGLNAAHQETSKLAKLSDPATKPAKPTNINPPFASKHATPVSLQQMDQSTKLGIRFDLFVLFLASGQSDLSSGLHTDL